MEERKIRNQYLKIRISQEEMKALKKKYENSKALNFSSFVRAMLFKGYIVHIDQNELSIIRQAANSASNNINQIAIRANATGNVYQEDITEVRKLADQIIAPLLELNYKLTYLKKQKACENKYRKFVR